ncbi:DUF5336 domain-containing protein [Gordonia soli]|uniref:Uncharacterized protein n=1 Tax=Gordonia soli NBRC 108243 TaxID=1223545 RepID=M0QNG7_9ACTN|nr:DUF5336 domain-containing protein [Gordonia soli]GAC68967.1 hypothetical protein GS4_20_00320 [Gordonia soli NBRC 108243]
MTQPDPYNRPGQPAPPPGAPGYGQPQGPPQSQQPGAPNYGAQPGQHSQPGQSQPGQAQPGQPQYGAPGYGSPQYGQPGQPPTSGGAHGTPGQGAPGYGAPAQGDPYGANHYGQAPGSPYGTPAYGQPGQQQPYGAASGFGAPAGVTGPVSSIVGIISWAIVGISVLVLISAFLPWVTGPVTVNGVGTSDTGATDGIITLVLALIAGGVAAASAIIRKQSVLHLIAGIVAIVAGLIVIAIAAVDISDVGDIEFFGFKVGIGLWLTLVFGILLTIAGIAAVVKRK